MNGWWLSWKKIDIKNAGKGLTKTGRRLPSDLWWCTWPRHQPAHAYCHSGSLFEDTFVLQKKSTQHSHWYTHIVLVIVYSSWLLRMGSTSWELHFHVDLFDVMSQSWRTLHREITLGVLVGKTCTQYLNTSCTQNSYTHHLRTDDSHQCGLCTHLWTITHVPCHH